MKVTNHSASSMREHFRKNLTRLSEYEQRELLSMLDDDISDRLENVEEKENQVQQLKMEMEEENDDENKVESRAMNPAHDEKSERVSSVRRTDEMDVLDDESDEDRLAVPQAPLSSDDKNACMEEVESSNAGKFNDSIEGNDDTVKGEHGTLNEHQSIAIVSQMTGHDTLSSCHALYYASGDIDTAIQFLRGRPSRHIWLEEEDKMLHGFGDYSQMDIRDAIASGKLALLARQHSAEEIHRRIQFLKG